MPRFFTQAIAGDQVTLTGEDAHHLSRALRARPGEEITVCDGEGFDYRCVLEGFGPQAVTARVLEKTPSRGELPRRVTLYQALCKGEKMETIVQKSVELGVWRIVPVITARCVSLPDPRSLDKKRDRWQKIALSAAQQSGRGVVPQVAQTLSFRQAAQAMARETAILFYEKASRPLGEVLGRQTGPLSIMTGPEGGFAPEEAAFLEEQGAALCTLGPRILRCETAPLCALSIIGAVWELL